MTTFNFNDLLALPEREQQTATRTFTFGDREWTITIKSGAKEDPELFYELLTAMQMAVDDETGISLMLPGGKKVLVRNKGYIAALNVLAAVSIDPPFKREEWALFGQRVGFDAIEEVTTWSQDANGLTEHLTKKLEEAKKNLKVDTSTNGSSVPVASFTTNPRKKSSRT